MLGSPPKKGGMAKGLRLHSFWLLALTVAFAIGFIQINEKRRNYTDLHHKVHLLEDAVNRIERKEGNL